MEKNTIIIFTANKATASTSSRSSDSFEIAPNPVSVFPVPVCNCHAILIRIKV